MRENLDEENGLSIILACSFSDLGSDSLAEINTRIPGGSISFIAFIIEGSRPPVGRVFTSEPSTRYYSGLLFLQPRTDGGR